MHGERRVRVVDRVVGRAPERRRGRPTGDLPHALREWCKWIYLHADLACRPGSLDPDGKPATWQTFCGVRERGLIEEAMRAGIWRPEERVDNTPVAAE
jgi:hypothetical protein